MFAFVAIKFVCHVNELIKGEIKSLRVFVLFSFNYLQWKNRSNPFMRLQSHSQKRLFEPFLRGLHQTCTISLSLSTIAMILPGGSKMNDNFLESCVAGAVKCFHIRLSSSPSLDLFIYLSMYLSTIYYPLSIYLPICLSAYLPTYGSIYLFIDLSVNRYI